MDGTNGDNAAFTANVRKLAEIRDFLGVKRPASRHIVGTHPTKNEPALGRPFISTMLGSPKTETCGDPNASPIGNPNERYVAAELN